MSQIKSDRPRLVSLTTEILRLCTQVHSGNLHETARGVMANVRALRRTIRNRQYVGLLPTSSYKRIQRIFRISEDHAAETINDKEAIQQVHQAVLELVESTENAPSSMVRSIGRQIRATRFQA